MRGAASGREPVVRYRLPLAATSIRKLLPSSTNQCEEMAMTTAIGTFEVERKGQTLVVTPRTNLRELDYEAIEAGAGEILHLLGNGTIRNVVLDFHRTDYYGSTALGFFVKLWKRVRDRNGRMAFCGVSEHEREILRATNLDGLWPICSSRQEAFEAVTSAGKKELDRQVLCRT
jgi:anti-anti-sigma factor